MEKLELNVPELGKIDFDGAEIINGVELFIPVRDIPEELERQIMNQVIRSPENHTKRMREIMSTCGCDIRKADLQLVPQLRIFIQEEDVQCSLIVYLEDADGELCCYLSLPVSMSAYKAQMAECVAAVLCDKIKLPV